jgi:hypothetical protein
LISANIRHASSKEAIRLDERCSSVTLVALIHSTWFRKLRTTEYRVTLYENDLIIMPETKNTEAGKSLYVMDFKLTKRVQCPTKERFDIRSLSNVPPYRALTYSYMRRVEYRMLALSHQLSAMPFRTSGVGSTDEEGTS